MAGKVIALALVVGELAVDFVAVAVAVDDISRSETEEGAFMVGLRDDVAIAIAVNDIA